MLLERPPQEPRVGQGYDIHRLVVGRPLVLGGVTIPADWGLAGHSDGDAVCHALIDALCGAAGLGDVGTLFPDDDPRWEGASSLDLVTRVGAAVTERGWRVVNVDVTVILETPRLRPYRDAMVDKLASALGTEAWRVGIKAKTNEGLGPVGGGEAIAALAVALLVPAAA